MKKILIFISCLLLITQSLISKDLFNDVGINLGFNTFRLVGDNPATEPIFVKRDNKLPHSGGGLNYIEPGVDLSATLFLDDNKIHRIIAGGEYISMNGKEAASIENVGYKYAYHKVSFIDAYMGYHFSFYKAPFQNVRIFAGLEFMFNNIILNELERGFKILPGNESSHYADSQYVEIYKKEPAFRIGSRIRVGFEGRIKENIYITASTTLGIYNLINRNDATKELFTIPRSLDTKESFQPFFNFLISFQYRFNDGG